MEDELREKRAECDNLDWRLKDRSEKLASVSLKMNDFQKENIRLRKRVETLGSSNQELNSMNTEKEQDLEKALTALNILKTEIESKSDQLSLG